MSSLLAVEISEKEATFVKAVSDGAQIDLLGSKSILVKDIQGLKNATKPEDNSEEENIEEAEQNSNNELEELLDFIGDEIDATYAVLKSPNIIYENIELPFNNEKQIASVAPLQIQDLLPFEVDEFQLENNILSQTPAGAYTILSTLAPTDEIRKTITLLGRLGLNPEVLTTKASSLAAITKFIPSESTSNTFLILSVDEEEASLAFFIDKQVVELRNIQADKSDPTKENLRVDIHCSIMRFQLEREIEIEEVFFIGEEKYLKGVLKNFNHKISKIDIAEISKIQSDSDKSLFWALGVLADRLKQNEDPGVRQINFRTGKFAFKSAWKSMLAALKEESFYFILVAAIAFIYAFSSIYFTNSELSKIEDTISKRVSTVVGEPAPKRREVSFIEEKIISFEEQLKNMGSLASLSPLELLKILSSEISPQLEIHIDSMNIRPDSINFRGSVPDLSSVGQLSTILERKSQVFCKVKVDPKGKDRGTRRFKYSADIQLCK